MRERLSVKFSFRSLGHKTSQFCDGASYDFYRASAQLAMQSPVLATIGMSVCCPSVRPSQAGTKAKRRKQARITKASLRDSLRILVFGMKRNSKGFTPARALNESGLGKIRNFQPITRRISETVQDRTKVTVKVLMTIRKLHTPFRLGSKSTTLDDLERPIRTLLQKGSVFRSPSQKFK